MTIIKRIMDNWKQWVNRKKPSRQRTRWDDASAETVLADAVEGKEQITRLQVPLVLVEPIRFMSEDFDPNWIPEPLEVTKFGDPKRIFLHADGTTHTQEFETTQPEGETP